MIRPTSTHGCRSGAVDAITNWVTDPYRLEVLENAHQPILQAEPAKLPELLLAHLSRLSGAGA